MFNLHSHAPNRRTVLKAFGLSVLGILLDACDAFNSQPAAPTMTWTIAPTPKPFAPAEATARAFLDAWSNANYGTLHELLAPSSRTQITREQLIQLYQSISQEATITAIDPTLLSTIEEGTTATAQFQVRYDTALLGSIEQANAFSLLRERERWGIVWSYSLVLKELTADRSVRLYPSKSTRGNIYDRTGNPIALGERAIVVSVWPAELRRNVVEAQAVAALMSIVGMNGAEIQGKYAGANPEWKIPIATVSAQIAQSNAETLSLPGVLTEPRDARTYPLGSAAAHVGGYIGEISAEEVDTWRNQGFRAGDVVGRTGLERAAEKYLSGGRGGR